MKNDEYIVRILMNDVYFAYPYTEDIVKYKNFILVDIDNNYIKDRYYKIEEHILNRMYTDRRNFQEKFRDQLL